MRPYQVSTPFSGMKPYNDSPGGYSGSPASVWQEGTWGMILMLLDLYSISGLASFFTGLGTTIDAVLTSPCRGAGHGFAGDGQRIAGGLFAGGAWPAL